MGRGKIEIKRIENLSNRQVTYSKRRNGITKKANEITVLCDAQVSLIIFASSGKMHEYCSPSTTLINLLDKYQKLSGKKLWEAKHENLSNEIDRIKKENDCIQIGLRHLNGEDITSLNPKELIALEDALEIGLSNIREKKMEYFLMKKRNGKILEEENLNLQSILQEKELALQRRKQMAMEASMREIKDGYPQQGSGIGDSDPQMPRFAFRVQPLQPNLQERM